MGLFDKLFGGKSAPQPKPALQARQAPLDDDALMAAVTAGKDVDFEAAIEERGDEAGFALLWRLLDASKGSVRVDIIDHLAEFELDDAQQRRLLHAGVTDVPGPEWTAASVAMACDLEAIAAAADAEDATSMQSLDEAGAILCALCEVTLTTGPAGTALDVDKSAAQVAALATAIDRVGASAADLVTLHVAEQLCLRGERDDELNDAGFNGQLCGHVAAVRDSALEKGGRTGPWTDMLPGHVRQGSLSDAIVALQAASVTGTGVRDALVERIADDPTDELTWDIALAAGLDERVLDLLAPIASKTLQVRRLGEDELCSPASQVGCLKCGGGTPAEDDALMVPTSLRDRVLPLLVACKQVPGTHEELLIECLAAPDASLRFHALNAFASWGPDTVPDEARELVATLGDDSMPAVQVRAKGVLAGL